MNEKVKLLNEVYYASTMAEHTIKVLMKDLADKDNKITIYLDKIKDKYSSFKKEASNLLSKVGCETEEPGFMAKMGSSMGIDKEVSADNSDSAIADMMIEGVIMGLNKIEKGLKDEGNNLDADEKKLANDFLKFQNSVIKNLKTYL